MTMLRDNRGLAVGMVIFVGVLVAAALLYILLDPALVTMFDMARGQTSSTVATDQIDRAAQIWGLLLFFPAFLGLLFIIARSVFESRRVG
jgi:hypothetical protein